MMKRVLCILMLAALVMMSACSQQPAKEVDLGAVMNDLGGKYGLNEGMLELTENDLMDLYGIQAADVRQFQARIRLESIQADEVVLIEAVDAKAAERVMEQLEARYQTKLNETRDYLPDEFAKIEKCRVMKIGNHAAMIICADGEAAAAEYEKAVR